MWVAFTVQKLLTNFSAKNIRIVYIESAKTVNEMTLNELVKLTTLWTTGPWVLWLLQHPGQKTHAPGRLQCQNGHRPPKVGRSDWICRSRAVQQQCPHPFKEVCRAWTADHQYFRLPSRRKTSWMHPRSKHWLLSDYVIVRRKDRQDVKVTKTFVVQTVLKDHRLVVSKLNLCIKPVRQPQGKRVPTRLNVSKLKQDSKRQAFVNDICSRLDALEHNLEDVDTQSAFYVNLYRTVIGPSG